MGLGLWTLMESGVLFVNALAIIDEDRFLKPRTFVFFEKQLLDSV
jgi:hypothetical protein